ncbi:hypothetical protein, partial [Kocuria rosea]|uniref:hypothetical protein n=1 Tax=Kocuria rosea TaxID=1275 RepID=UPI001C92CCE5
GGGRRRAAARMGGRTVVGMKGRRLGRGMRGLMRWGKLERRGRGREGMGGVGRGWDRGAW